MNQDQALVPQLIIRRGNRVLDNALAVTFGVTLLSLLAQLAVLTPWSPVPITGQTFGVALTALLWGRKRGLAVILTYLTIGAAGMPVFALGKAGFTFGPTIGYLIGMAIAAYAMGTLSDKGWTNTPAKTWLAATTGSLITFICGTVVLSVFVPTNTLFTVGVLPFLPGDFIKTALVTLIVVQTQRSLSK